MSETTEISARQMDLSDISQIRYSFRLNWTVSLDTLRNPRKPLNSNSVPFSSPNLGLYALSNLAHETPKVCSRLYNFKDVKFSPFYLELQRIGGRRPSNVFKLLVKSTCIGYNNFVKLEHAFVVIKGRMFYLSIPGKSPLAYVSRNQFKCDTIGFIPEESNELIIHCRIAAVADVRCSLTQTPHDESNAIVSREMVVCESSISETPDTNDDTWETTVCSSASAALTNYLRSGELPNLDVDLAKELLVGSGEKDSEMKVLSAEYLMANLTADNVVDILSLSITHGIRVLQLTCTEYLKQKCSVEQKLDPKKR